MFYWDILLDGRSSSKYSLFWSLANYNSKKVLNLIKYILYELQSISAHQSLWLLNLCFVMQIELLFFCQSLLW